MAPLSSARKEHWKTVFQKAWDIIKEDVDTGGECMAGEEASNDDPEAKNAIFCLDNEIEAFILAVRRGDFDPGFDQELVDRFCELANHRNATPLVKDWVVVLHDDYDRMKETDEVSSCLQNLVGRLQKPQVLEAEHELTTSILEKLRQNMEAASKDRLRCILLNLIYVERDAWRAGKAQVPELEKRILSHGILRDIQYVEKEAFGTMLADSDNLYVDTNTAEEDRLQKLCDRIVEMWEKWHPAGSKSGSAGLLKPQKGRRGQKSPANEPKEAPPSPKAHVLEAWLGSVLIGAVAVVAESRVSQVILEHFPRRFIRSFEQAPVDSALLLEDFFDPHQESLERHRHLELVSDAPRFLPVEIKSLTAHMKGAEAMQGRFVWSTNSSLDQKRHGLVILISSADPGRIVLCPSGSLFQYLDDSGNGKGRNYLYISSESRPGQTFPPTFPSNLQPYEISISDLPEVLRLLLNCACDGTKVWRNPATNVRFDGWQLETSRNRNLLVFGGISEKMVRTLHAHFRDFDSRYQFRVNALAPLLGDGHFFREKDGQQRFVELREGHLRVFRDGIGHTVNLSPDKPYRSLCTWRRQRDWLLSIPSSNSGAEASALLIPWEKLPEHWRERGYSGERYAPACIGDPDNIRQYLLPWPGTRGSWRRFCDQVGDRLDRAAPPSRAHGTDFLRTLPPDMVSTSINKGNMVYEPEADSPPKKPSRKYEAEIESQHAFGHRSALALHRILVKSGEGVVADAGPQCKISRYLVCRRHLPSSAPKNEAAYANISLLPCTALLMPVQFIRVKGASTTEKKSACPYDLRDWGPGLLVCDSRDPNDLDTPHGRQVADSRDFPTQIKVHAAFNPSSPMVWEDCDTNEIEGDERNIVQRILKVFQPDGERQPPVVLAATVFRNMFTSSKFS